MTNDPPAPQRPVRAERPEGALLQLGLRLVIYPLFFVSGAAGLIYEVVWTRILLSIFGAGLFAVCAVLAAFMAGLALGSWLLGRVSDRLRRPLRLYAALELAIGVCGLILPIMLRHASVVDGWAYRHWGDNFHILTTFRFSLTFLAMLAPTTLMGATLPILSRFMVREESHLGFHIGGLYAINTFGAVAGTFLAGFVLIGRFGLIQTEWIAAALNFGVGFVAVLLALGLERQPQYASHAAPVARPAAAAPGNALSGKFVIILILATAFVSGGVSLAAQVLWTRSLVFVFEYLKNTTYAFSAMLTVFLIGLAVGSALVGMIIDRQRNPLRLYAILLTLIGMTIMFSVVTLHSGVDQMILGSPYNEQTGVLNWYLAVANVMTQSFGVLFIPTLLMGMAFPVAARVVVQLGRVGTGVGRLYALNTLGAILGSILAGFFIVPALGLTRGLVVLGCIDTVMGLIILKITSTASAHFKIFAVLSCGMLVVVLTGIRDTHGLQRALTPLDEQIYYKEGALATVSVVQNNVDERTLYVDGVGVAGTDPILQTDQKSLAHVPMMILAAPRSFLTVGFGGGGCSYSLALHDRLQKIDCVEICPTVLETAPFLTAANHGILGTLSPTTPGAVIPPEKVDPRYRIVLDDAKAYLNYAEQKYDVIATDCTDLRYKSNANLYDVEYFRACREHLTEDGLVVVWMPLGGLSLEIFKVALRTFHVVFPEMGIFYMDNEPTHYILLIGWQKQIELDYRLFEACLHEPDVRSDLAELYLDDPVKLLSCFITGGQALTDYLAEGKALNTENEPIIEFESPKYGYLDKPLVDNLADLMTIRVSPRRFLKPGSVSEEEVKRLERYEKALPLIVQGHAFSRNMELENATRYYMKAHEIAPEDLSVRNLLTFPILQVRTQKEAANPIPPYLLGRVNMIQNTPEKLRNAYSLLGEAERRFVQAQGRNPTDDAARMLTQTRQWRQQIEPAFETEKR